MIQITEMERSYPGAYELIRHRLLSMQKAQRRHNKVNKDVRVLSDKEIDDWIESDENIRSFYRTWRF